MTPESPTVRTRAAVLSADPDVVEGPLHGYHHETYVFPLPAEAGVGPQGRWKCREPRENLLWFDRRCFLSEERLLFDLQQRIDVVPEVVRVGGFDLQRFVEGSTLGELFPSGEAVPDAVLAQIQGLFRQLVDITADTLSVERRCSPEDRAVEGDSAEFLDRLICFTQAQVYERNLPEYEALFAGLGLGPDSFRYLRKRVAGLQDRPFCLLHADLHRENFILDPAGKLWAIDWELAMFGDPLYDLATHLYLMRYPARQERILIQRWCETVEAIRRGSSRGWFDDLPKLRDFKKAQSVFTDVIRETQSLRVEGQFDRRRLRRAAEKVWGVLRGAAAPLGLETVPSLLETEAALSHWRSDQLPA